MLRKFLLVLLVCLATGAQAQSIYEIDGAQKRFDLSLQAGYQVSPTFFFAGGQQKITDSGSFGGSLGWRSARTRNTTLRSEIFYLYMPSGVTTDTQPESRPLDIHYVQAAALYETGNQRIRGFITFGAGVSIFHVRDASFVDQWLFTMIGAIGMKLKIVSGFGLRAQARALVPMFFTGGGFFCGYSACTVAVSGGGAIFQADFTAGPYFEFG